MYHYYFHHFRVGDFEVPEGLFKGLIGMIERKDDKGHQRFKIQMMYDSDEPNIRYVYAWCRNSDFLYIGYIEYEG